jgi:hypothetical protein
LRPFYPARSEHFRIFAERLPVDHIGYPAAGRCRRYGGAGQPCNCFQILRFGVQQVPLGLFSLYIRHQNEKHVGMTALIEQKFAACTHPANASIPENDTKLVVERRPSLQCNIYHFPILPICGVHPLMKGIARRLNAAVMIKQVVDAVRPNHPLVEKIHPTETDVQVLLQKAEMVDKLLSHLGDDSPPVGAQP